MTLSAIAKVGASAGISGLGNAAYDVTGTTSAETIVGTAHDDRLNGLTGNDTLTGGDGADTFVFGTALNSRSNVDKITDFNVAQGDVIELSSTIFAGLATDAGGHLSSDAFALNTATGVAPQIVYDSASGASLRRERRGGRRSHPVRDADVADGGDRSSWLLGRLTEKTDV